jgi:hypothetical protein
MNNQKGTEKNSKKRKQSTEKQPEEVLLKKTRDKVSIIFEKSSEAIINSQDQFYENEIKNILGHSREFLKILDNNFFELTTIIKKSLENENIFKEMENNVLNFEHNTKSFTKFNELSNAIGKFSVGYVKSSFLLLLLFLLINQFY